MPASTCSRWMWIPDWVGKCSPGASAITPTLFRPTMPLPVCTRKRSNPSRMPAWNSTRFRTSTGLDSLRATIFAIGSGGPTSVLVSMPLPCCEQPPVPACCAQPPRTTWQPSSKRRSPSRLPGILQPASMRRPNLLGLRLEARVWRGFQISKWSSAARWFNRHSLSFLAWCRKAWSSCKPVPSVSRPAGQLMSNDVSPVSSSTSSPRPNSVRSEYTLVISPTGALGPIHRRLIFHFLARMKAIQWENSPHGEQLYDIFRFIDCGTDYENVRCLSFFPDPGACRDQTNRCGYRPSVRFLIGINTYQPAVNDGGATSSRVASTAAL